jgi:hypothetical protein
MYWGGEKSKTKQLTKAVDFKPAQHELNLGYAGA